MIREAGRRNAHSQHNRRPATSASKGLKAVDTSKMNVLSRKEYDRKYGQIKVK